MCDSRSPVGMRSTIVRVFGSMTMIVFDSSPVTYSRPSAPNTGSCGRSGWPRSIVATRVRDAMSITSMVRPSVPGRPTPESP